MDIQELDPSMLLGFLIRSQEDLDDLIGRLDRALERAYPLLTVVDDREKSLASTPSSTLSLQDMEDMDAAGSEDLADEGLIVMRSSAREEGDEKGEGADENADMLSVVSLDDDEEFELEGDAFV